MKNESTQDENTVRGRGGVLGRNNHDVRLKGPEMDSCTAETRTPDHAPLLVEN